MQTCLRLSGYNAYPNLLLCRRVQASLLLYSTTGAVVPFVSEMYGFGCVRTVLA